ncbi:hypothetical protein [Okeania hirsuta]|uniref:Uncharacterized protein n=1 Tax=Okeania hirsuta TaxID=1458930 RepID=A0A3N6RDG8_9CYAN|nr:hypothetical protein [Okeania hirsuta]RQH18620.1 hypothetical protein D4Z78_14945 [Okeania hirsuta]RQH26132.1 hypothetical protein D5R40_28530 [Okeania hirsuta]
MNSQNSQHLDNISGLDRVVVTFLVAFSMFIVSYSATRVYLTQSSEQSPQVESNVIPHPASLWSGLGR